MLSIFKRKNPDSKPSSVAEIFVVFLPLTLSWFFMSCENQVNNMFLAARPDSIINLAAYGTVVWAIALLAESPIFMILSASTSISKDLANFYQLRRFFWALAAVLTLFHLSLCIPGVYDFVALTLLGASTKIAEVSFSGLLLASPWTWFVGYRRLVQGLLINFGRADAIGKGTLLRLIVLVIVLGLSIQHPYSSTVNMTVLAVDIAIFSEMLYIHLVYKQLLSRQVIPEKLEEPRSYKYLFKFYLPLAMTSVLGLAALPIGSAALYRMPEALLSVAAWPVVVAAYFILRAPSFAIQEVVISIYPKVELRGTLKKFVTLIMIGMLMVCSFIGFSSLANVWFLNLTGIAEKLFPLTLATFQFGILVPSLGIAMFACQGVLISKHRSNEVWKGMLIYVLTITAIMWLGVALQVLPGAMTYMLAWVTALLFQALYLYARVKVD